MWKLIQTTGIVNAINCTIENSIAEGGATFNAFVQNGNVDNGGNSGWDFGSRTLYWVGEGGNWSDTGHWSLSSGGEGGEDIPTNKDNVIFDSNSISLEDQSVKFSSDEISYLKTLDMTDLQHQIILNSNSLDAINQVVCGSLHTVVLTENGDVHGWGNNAHKQTNPSTATTPWLDTSTIILSGVKQIACGALHTISLMENGDVHAWGYNIYKQSNPSSAVDPWIDTSTVILSGVKQIACGSTHTMVLMENGDVHGWGSNGWPQVNPLSSTDPWIDTSTVILSGVKQIACGSSHTVVLMENGDVHGWGANSYGQSNPASPAQRWLDSSTVILSGVKQIACGHYNTLAIMENGDVHAWGYNGDKQTNPASATDPWLDSSTVILSGVKQIASGIWGIHTVALMENGDVHAWGSNYNKETNPNSDIDPWIDVNTVILSGAKYICSSEYNTFFIMENGDVHGLGKNDSRQTNPFSATTPWIDNINPIIDTNKIWHISVSQGMINAYKSTIKNSSAIGGASFFALESNGNIDAGNNIGWVFD